MIIRDPVQGDIFLTREQAAVVDAPEVQRLRGIKQTGTAYLVYPGCLHTRFDHSLGTLATANRIIEALRRNGYQIEKEYQNLVGVAAILHDVTHIPFGHTFEDERQIFPRHDAGQRYGYFFRESALARILEKLALRDSVLEILGKSVAAGGGFPPWLGEIVSACIDADLLDYLHRDAYFAGLSQRYDERIFSSFVIERGHLAVNLVKHKMDRPDTRSELVHLLRMRYFLTERIYTHHAKLASGAMISRAVERAKAKGFREEELYTHTDYTFLDLIEARLEGEPAARLVSDLKVRKLHKRAYVLSRAALGRERQEALIRRFAPAREREKVEAKIASKVGIPKEWVIIYCPPATYFKEAAALVNSQKGFGPLNRLDLAGTIEVQALQQQYEDLWRFYLLVPEEARLQAALAAETLIGERNEFKGGRVFEA